MPTHAIPFRQTSPIRSIHRHFDLRVIGIGFSSFFIFVVVFVDALVQPRASYDLRLMQTVQNINVPLRDAVLPRVENLTDSRGAVFAWFCVLAAFVIVRHWNWALVVALVPAGGVVNHLFGTIVTRARPHAEELLRTSLNPEERSFPSGHVMGAVMLYGLVIVAVGKLRQPAIRALIRGGCLAIIAISGFQRLWVGAHWPSDVIGGYALGGVLLACLLICRAYLDSDAGLQGWQVWSERLHRAIGFRLLRH